MSILGNVGAAAAARDARLYIDDNKIEKDLGRKLTADEQQVLRLVVAFLRSIERAADSGWY